MLIQKHYIGRTTAAMALALAVAAAACGPDDRVPGPAPSPSPQPIPADVPGGEQYPDDADRDVEAVPSSPEISVSPRSGDTNTRVTIMGSGFIPDDSVRIGFGPPESEYEIFARTMADGDGRIRVDVDVPDWADSGRDYLFVAVQRPEEEAISEPFRVQ